MQKNFLVILIMMMLFTLTACTKETDQETSPAIDPEYSSIAEKDTRSDAEKFIGTWSIEYDLTDDFINAFFESLTTEDFAKYADPSKKVFLDLSYTFKKDGTLSFKISKTAYDKFIGNYTDFLYSICCAWAQDYIKENNIDMSPEKYLEQTGFTGPYIYGSLRRELDVSLMSNEGKYEIKNGKLYVVWEKEGKIDTSANIYTEYIIVSDNEIQLTKQVGTDTDLLLLGYSDSAFPVTMKKK